MHYNVWHDKNLCGTNLCNLILTHIIHINSMNCPFTVYERAYTYHLVMSGLRQAGHIILCMHGYAICKQLKLSMLGRESGFQLDRGKKGGQGRIFTPSHLESSHHP